MGYYNTITINASRLNNRGALHICNTLRVFRVRVPRVFVPRLTIK